MGLREITTIRLLVSENFWNGLVSISSIILLQLTPGLWKTPLLDVVDDGETVPNNYAIHYYISNSHSPQGRNICDLALNSDSSSLPTLEIYTIGY